MEPEHPRAAAYDRFSQLVDGPLMVLAIAMIPLLLAPIIFDLSDDAERALLAADYVIWALFAIEYVTKLSLAPDRPRFFRTHLLDLALVALPMLRPLRALRSVRILRMLRLARLAGFAVRAISTARKVLRTRGLNFVLLIVIALVFASAGLVLEFERGGGGSIDSFTDALWWAVTTVTTVGYGDMIPLTAAGRGIAVVLMVAGIATFGILTAAIAAYFVETDEQKEDGDVASELRSMTVRLEMIERRLAGEVTSSDAQPM